MTKECVQLLMFTLDTMPMSHKMPNAPFVIKNLYSLMYNDDTKISKKVFRYIQGIICVKRNYLYIFSLCLSQVDS